jgi:hypothetical protein
MAPLLWLGRFARLPLLLRMGTLVFTLGGLAELLYHLAPTMLNPLAPLAGPDGAYTHIAVYTGLLLILAGVFELGLSADH